MIPHMTAIGTTIRKARQARAMSQDALATEIRRLTRDTFSRAALAQIESGSTKLPKAKNLQAACDALGIDFRSALAGRLAWTRDPMDDEPQVFVRRVVIDDEDLLAETMRRIRIYEAQHDVSYTTTQLVALVFGVYDALVRERATSDEEMARLIQHIGKNSQDDKNG